MPTSTSSAAALHAALTKINSPDRALHNTLVSLYARTDLPSALRLLPLLPFPPSTVSFTALISASPPSTALRLLLSMLRRPLLPSSATLSALLSLLPPSHLPSALSLHALALKLSLHRLPFAGSALVHFYSKAHLPDSALQSFHDIAYKDPVCYGAVITALARNHRSTAAITLFVASHSDTIPTNSFTLAAALRSAAQLASLEQAKILHAHAVTTGLDSGVIVATTLLDAYGKSGLITDARNIFDGLSTLQNLVTYNAMLAAYAQQGDVGSVRVLFDEMLQRDELTFLAVLTACSNAGLADEAERWIDSMMPSYGVQPCREHYCCLVGALARAGRMVDAQRVAVAMPFEADVAVWRMILSGCVVHGAVEMGREVGRRLLAMDPHDDAAYVMLANICSVAGRKDEMAEVLVAMRDMGVKKEGGRSWVEMKGEVHMFVAGEQRHEGMNNIYTKLMELEKEVRRRGYVETDEAVRYHSERLAVAFAVLSGAALEGKLLRVVKNLRICRHCHEFFKYLSLVMKREIVVRDVNRYHNFQNGSCSCREYW